ncbi:hypothetical protein [Trinickia sp. EG282A]|uniref:hypothetical protein n=1 Tax=Trinickia sp. EG282A TaxID=3237013 RepID=UPI0034D22AFB
MERRKKVLCQGTRAAAGGEKEALKITGAFRIALLKRYPELDKPELWALAA